MRFHCSSGVPVNCLFCVIGVVIKQGSNFLIPNPYSSFLSTFYELFLQAIKTLEEEMTTILKNFPNLLKDTYKKGKFHRDDLIAVMQGITGFGKAIASKDPLDFIDAALGTASSLSGKACLKSLDSYLGSAKRWLTFGEKYKALTDSSDLDFDQVAVSSVPEIMQVSGFVDEMLYNTSFNFKYTFTCRQPSLFCACINKLINLLYYMAGSASGQDESNPAL